MQSRAASRRALSSHAERRSIAPTTIAQQVYDRVRQDVLTGRLEPGHWIREQDIADEIGVSRTPVREAVRRLAQDGLLDVAPNRGVRVAAVSATHVDDVYEVRELVEGLSARRAAERAEPDDVVALRELLDLIDRLEPGAAAMHIEADDALHRRIAEIGRNTAVVDVLDRLNGKITRIKVLTSDTNPSPTTRSQHGAIVDAIAIGDAVAAERVMRAHIRTYRELVVERVERLKRGT
jgi:DNA-binding GntR family transcriptional regulator